MIGEATLVPPKTVHADCVALTGANTATPVFGSAMADTSATVLLRQPVSNCHTGLAYTVLHPLPAPLHAVSLQPRALLLRTRLVPPTAVTCGDDAGNSTPKPPSPELAVTAIPFKL